MKKLNFINQEFLNDAISLLRARDVSFQQVGYAISVKDEDYVHLLELQFQYFTDSGSVIVITNNNNEYFGHDSTKPLTDARVAAELFMSAKIESDEWYYRYITPVSDINSNKDNAHYSALYHAQFTDSESDTSEKIENLFRDLSALSEEYSVNPMSSVCKTHEEAFKLPLDGLVAFVNLKTDSSLNELIKSLGEAKSNNRIKGEWQLFDSRFYNAQFKVEITNLSEQCTGFIDEYHLLEQALDRKSVV